MIKNLKLITNCYQAGFDDAQSGMGFKPLDDILVCNALSKVKRYNELANLVANGNFNQADVIKLARELAE